MNSNIWGPGAWTLLHSITFNYPKTPSQQDKNEYADFFYSLANVLPCATCQNHFRKNLNDLPLKLHLQSRNDLVKWLFEIHNLINIQTNKKTITFKKFQKIYKQLYSKSTESLTYYKNKNKLQRYIIYILIIIIIIIILIHKKYHKILFIK